MKATRYVFLLMLVLASCTRPSDAPATDPMPAGPKPEVLGKIEAVEGGAFVTHAAKRTKAVAEATLLGGDVLETEADGKIRAKLIDDSVLSIGSGTKLSLTMLGLEDGRKGRIDVTIGKFWTQISKWTKPGASSYEVVTPSAVAGVRGTTLWGDTELDTICALEGTIEVSSRKDGTLTPATLTAGNCAAELSKGKLAPVSPGAEQIDKYLKEVLIAAP